MPLTSLSHGGGCGCKLAPAVLEQIIAKSGGRGLVPPDLLVGIETSDDAAVYRISDDQAIVATTDFFMPIVDDPFDFGAIAATNAISDVYAMGGQPLFALALVAMPIDKLPIDTIRRILEGGESVCQRAGIPVAGGHSVDSVEAIYGLVAIGLVNPRHVKRNADAKPGDKIVLGKALGVGCYGAAVKKQKVTDAQYRELIASTTQLNTPGMRLARLAGVHALTDVTGFGLLGHCWRYAAAPAYARRCAWSAVPLLTEARELASAGYVTGGSARNWRVRKPRRSDEPRRHRAGDSDRPTDERRPAGRMRTRVGERGARLFPGRRLSSRRGHRRDRSRIAGRVSGIAPGASRCTVGWKVESDTCLVVVTVFKIVAPALCAGGWVRFPPSPPAFARACQLSESVSYGWQATRRLSAVALAKADSSVREHACEGLTSSRDTVGRQGPAVAW